jgi:hypothetical protein
VSLRGGDFKLICGRDAAIGYTRHDEKQVRLYLEESFSAELTGPGGGGAAALRAPATGGNRMKKFEIAPLPYPKNALAPHIGAETVELHYEKHHRGYADKLNELVRGKPEADHSLEDLIRTKSGEVFNNAAQVWNHNFYWLSMKPDGGGEPSDASPQDRRRVRIVPGLPRASSRPRRSASSARAGRGSPRESAGT